LIGILRFFERAGLLSEPCSLGADSATLDVSLPEV